MAVTRRITVAAIAATLALAAWGVIARPWQRLPNLPIGGDFSLVDHNGAPFSLAQLRGKVVLVFFGYSSCPDVCPTTLSKLSSVARQLGDDAARVKTLYITVDPERDTPNVLKADLQSFRLDALGLTGSRAQIDSVVKLFDASYTIVPTPLSLMRYTVTHSTTLYALDARGLARMTFPYEATVQQITDGVRRVLAAHPSSESPTATSAPPDRQRVPRLSPDGD